MYVLSVGKYYYKKKNNYKCLTLVKLLLILVFQFVLIKSWK